MIGPKLYNSNLVAAISNGNTVVAGNPTGSYGSPGPTSCVGAQTSGNGCMNNGDVWTVDVAYLAGKLSVSLEDGAGGFVSIISGYAIALGSNIFAGFTGSTGSYTDSGQYPELVDDLQRRAGADNGRPVRRRPWRALGFMRTRRRAV